MRKLNKIIRRLRYLNIQFQQILSQLNLIYLKNLDSISEIQDDMSPSLRLNFLMSSRNLLLSCLEKKDWHLIPSLIQRESPIPNTWQHQNDTLKWDFDPGDKILDIGSGGHPFSFATHLADKYPSETTHRVESIVTDERPFSEVDIEKMPFKNKEYDFVFCSHVLEHLEDPGSAMRELMRISRKGYIEIPTRLSDILFNFTYLKNHHKWHGLILDNTVILIEWSDSERKKYNHQFFNSIHSEYRNGIQNFSRVTGMFFTPIHVMGWLL